MNHFGYGYLGQVDTRAEISPFRIGHLFREDAPGQLRRALLLAGTCWGGARGPLLPIGADGEVYAGAMQVAESLRPDLIVDYTRDRPTERSAWAFAESSPWQVVAYRPSFENQIRRWSPHILVTYTPEEAQNAELFLPGDDQALVNLAGPGHLADPAEIAELRHSGFRIDSRSSDLQLATHAQIRRASVMEATRRYDCPYYAAGGGLSTLGLVWLTDDPDSVSDVLGFWEARALRPRLGNSVDVLTTSAVAREPKFREALHTALRATSRTTPSCVLLSYTLDTGSLREIAEHLGLVLYTDAKLSENHGVDSLDRPLSAMVDIDVCQFWLCSQLTGMMTDVATHYYRPTTTIRIPSPISWHPRLVATGRVNLTLASRHITGPRRPSVARLYHRDTTWTEDGHLRIVTNPNPTYRFDFEIPTEAQILEAACREHSVSFTLSDKGRQLQGLLNVEIDHGRYRQASVHAIIKAITPQPSKELLKDLDRRKAAGQADDTLVEAIIAASAGTQRNAYTFNDIISSRLVREVTTGRIRVGGILADLVAHRLVLRGFRADCTLCDLRDFREMSAVTPAAVCTGCGSPATYYAEKGEPAICYRLNSLLARTSRNGGLAPLAAAALLRSEGGYVLPGVNVTRADDPIPAECDLLGWNGSTFYAGEAKTSTNGFAPDEMRDHVKVSKSIGADQHLAVCSEPLTSDQRDELRRLCDEAGISLRILAGPDLLG